ERPRRSDAPRCNLAPLAQSEASVTKQHVRYMTILFDNDTMMSIRSNTHPQVVRDRLVGARSSMTRDKVVLAYSAGLDTSIAIRWLQDRGPAVVASTVDGGRSASRGTI